MTAMTFMINDDSTSDTNPNVWVTITEIDNGKLFFDVTQEGGTIGDLRGLFFDVADESILSTLLIDAVSNDIQISEDSVTNLGGGSNMNGLLGTDKGYDVGIEIGTSGISKDDISGYTFTVSSSSRAMTLSDFSQVDFAARLTSVGIVSGKRVDSSKLLESTSIALQLENADASIFEDVTLSGNVLGGLELVGSTQITGWSGEAVGSQLLLESENQSIGLATLNYDGSYELDATMANILSEGESIIFDLSYSAMNQDESTSWSTDTASFTIVINGVNDEPTANDDIVTADENAIPVVGSVLLNDSDIDRLDTIHVASWSGGALGSAVMLDNGAGASFLLNADGSYLLDASNADALSEGETITQSFSYTLSDNHGATDVSVVNITITGINDAPDANDDTTAISENMTSVIGSVLLNDNDIDRLDTIHVLSWDGGEFGSAVTLNNGAGASFLLNADGSYLLDASNADALSEGETITQSFSYTLSDNHGATDISVINVSISGTNDVPDAAADTAYILEDEVVSGNVLSNDSDVDRMDVLTVSSIDGIEMGENTTINVTLPSGAIVTMNADGNYTYDTNGAFDTLNTAETAIDTFSYTISDGHGGTDMATVTLHIEGTGSEITNNETEVIEDYFPDMLQDISNIVLYLDDGDNTTDILKVKLQPSGLEIKDVDDLEVFNFIADNAALLGNDDQLAGISVHAGLEYPNVASYDLTAQGEGAFYFLLDGEIPYIEAVGTRDGNTWVLDWEKDDVPLSEAALEVGFNYELLGQQASIVYSQFDAGVWFI